jgi:hypothetical protein
MRFLLSCFALALVATGASAQRGRAGDTPSIWMSVSGGYLLMANVPDGSTGANWGFGDGWPFRLSLEKTIRTGTSVGVSFLRLRAPLLYVAPTGCGTCNAHATVAMYGAVLRLESGRGFNQVFELGAGAMQYGDFREDDTGDALPPDEANLDFAFSLGLGIAVPLWRDWAIEVMGTSINAVHERANLPNNAQTMRQHNLLRAGLRVGF